MSVIRCFEDMIAWQKARELVLVIYRETATAAFARDPAFTGQLRRTAVAVMTGIAGGFTRSRAGDASPVMDRALANSAEVRSQLALARDLGYLNAPTHAVLHERCLEIDRLLYGFRRAVENRGGLRPPHDGPGPRHHT